MSAPSTGTAEVRLGLRGDRGPILGALMLSTALVALDVTILATASTTVAQRARRVRAGPVALLGVHAGAGRDRPLYGRLADVFGRKRVMMVGIGLFLLGSVLCAVAWSMPALIWFRVLQGLGAGAIMPMSMTIAGDIYTLAERAKIAGLPRERVGRLVGARPDPRRRVQPVRELALDLLGQRADRRWSRPGALAPVPREEARGRARAHRLPRRRPAHRRQHGPRAGPPRGRARVGLGIAAVGGHLRRLGGAARGVRRRPHAGARTRSSTWACCAAGWSARRRRPG